MENLINNNNKMSYQEEREQEAKELKARLKELNANKWYKLLTLITQDNREKLDKLVEEQREAGDLKASKSKIINSLIEKHL